MRPQKVKPKNTLCDGCPLFKGKSVCRECASNTSADYMYAIQRKSKRQQRIAQREKHKKIMG